MLARLISNVLILGNLIVVFEHYSDQRFSAPSAGTRMKVVVLSSIRSRPDSKIELGPKKHEIRCILQLFDSYCSTSDRNSRDHLLFQPR